MVHQDLEIQTRQTQGTTITFHPCYGYADGFLLLDSQALLGSRELFITKVNDGTRHMN